MPNRSTICRGGADSRRRVVHLVVAVASVLAASTALTSGASAGTAQEPSATTTPAGPGSSTIPPSTTTPSTTVPVDDGCDQRVFDPDGALVEGPAVAAAVQRLVDQGIDLHVRVVDRMPGGDEVRRLEETCEWRAADGSRGERAAVLVVVPGADRAGLWYGAGLRPVVGARFAALAQPTVSTTGVAQLVDDLGALVAAGPIDDPLGCTQLVYDPGGELRSTEGPDGAAEVEDAAMALQAEGNDLRVRVEPPTDEDIDARLVQLEATCPGWTVDGDRPADRVIVMVQTSQRSTGLWYGRDFADSLAGRWEAIQTETMNPRFQAGRVAEGLARGLDQLRASGRVPYTSDSRGLGSGYDSSGGSSGGSSSLPVGPFLLLGLLIVGGWGFSYLSWKAKVDSGETTESFSSYTASRSGSSRRRSWSSGGGRSSGSRRSSGGGSRRSSGGGRRSGGGSSRW